MKTKDDKGKNPRKDLDIDSQSREYTESIIATVREPLITLDPDLKVVSASRSFYKFFKVKPEETIGKRIYDLGNKQWDIPGLRELLEDILLKNTAFDDYEIEHDFLGIGRRIMLLNARSIPRSPEKPKVILLAIEDITERKQKDEEMKASEAQYHLLAEHMTDIVWMMNMDLNVTWLSPSAVKARGFSVDEITALPLDRQLTPKSLEKAVNWLGKLMRLEKDGRNPEPDGTLSRELEFYCKDGHTIVLACTFQFIRDKQGKATSILAEGRDITARKRAELELQKTENTYRLLAEHMADIVWLMDEHLGIRWLSPSNCKLRGYSLDEIYALPLDRQLTPESLRRATNWLGKLLLLEEEKGRSPDTDSSLERGLEFYCKDGHTVWLDCTFQFIRDETGKVTGILGEGRDITDRKQAEQALRESERDKSGLLDKLNEAQHLAIIGSWEWDLQTNQVWWSDETYRIYGVLPQDFVPSAKVNHKFIHPDDLALYEKSFEHSFQTGGPLDCDCRLVTNDGLLKYCHTKGKIIYDGSGKQVRFIGAVMDVTERKQAEEALRESEQLYHSLFENMLNGFAYCKMLFDQGQPRDLIYLSVNAAFEKQTGLKNVIGKKITEVLPGIYEADPHLFEVYGRVALTGIPENAEIYSSALGQWLSLSLYSPEKEYLVAIFDVITERKLAEEKLEKSYESLKKTLNDAINTMVKIVEIRDPYTAGHQHKVADLATAIARQMKLEDTRIDQIRMEAVIHDIGKIYIPSDILSRPGKLSDMEFSLIKTHSRSGYDIVKSMDFPCVIAQTVLQHHERLDGSGYPNGLKGEDTLLEAKILAVADVVEAMSSHRPYRPALGIDKALEEISKNKGTLYDPDVVDACEELFKSGNFEFKPV